MEFMTVLSASQSLLEVGTALARLIKSAEEQPLVIRKAILYLDAARGAVQALGSYCGGRGYL